MYLGLSPALVRRQRQDEIHYDVVDVSERPFARLFYWLKRNLRIRK